jgi:hypothetical protein
MNQNKNVFYALSDELIFQIRELLQLSLLTDTNIVDHFRQLRLKPGDSAADSNHLFLTEEYKQYHLGIVAKMMDEVKKLQEQEGKNVSATLSGETNE